jgi:xanthine/uracil permease
MLIFSLLQRDLKENLFYKNRFSGEMVLIFGLCISCHPKWVSRIGTLIEDLFLALGALMGTLLEIALNKRLVRGKNITAMLFYCFILKKL